MRLKNKNSRFQKPRVINIEKVIERIIKRETRRENLLIKETVNNLSRLLSLPDRNEKSVKVRRVSRILEESKNKKEIVDFLDDKKPYRDLVVIMVKKEEGKRVFLNLKIEPSIPKSIEYKDRQEKLKAKLGKRFIKSKIIIVNERKTDNEIKKEWKKILSEFKTPERNSG